MADWTFPSPDNHYLQNPPPAEVRNVEGSGMRKWPEIDLKNPVLVLTKRVSSDVGGIIHVAERWTISQTTAQKTAELKTQQEGKEAVVERYQSLHAEIDRDFVILKLGDLLRRPRKRFLESHLNSLYNWKFDSENNIVIWGTKVIKKWSAEYNSMVVTALEWMRLVLHAMLRKSESDWIDPKEIKESLSK